MGRLRRLNRGGRLLLALVVGGAVFGIAAVVQADVPDGGVIHGCYNKVGNGSLRVIDTSSGQHCNSIRENPLDWNAAGVTGAQGATGPTGPTGPSAALANYGLETTATLSITNVATLTLSTGTYSLSGTVWAMSHTSSPDAVRCELTETGGTATLHAPSKGTEVFLSESADATMPVVGDITVSSGPTTVQIRCIPQDATSFQGTLFATAVGSVTAQ